MATEKVLKLDLAVKFDCLRVSLKAANYPVIVCGNMWIAVLGV